MSLQQTESFENNNILVVGGSGFVGSNLVKAILRASPNVRVTIVDNLLSAEKENVPEDPRVSFVKGSIADDQIVNRITDEFDIVFHLATFHGNQNSMFDPLKDLENNTLTTLKLFWRLKDFKRLKKVVYSGAGCAVAEKTFDVACATKEDAPITLSMDSPYSISKISGEFYSVYFHNQHALPVVRARFQNVYGPGEILGAGVWRGTKATVWRNVTPVFVYKSLKGESLPLENEGLSSRDFIYVEDIVKGLLLCALKGKAGDVYNLASGTETTIADLALKINHFTGNTAPFQMLPRRTWDHSGRRFGSPEKSKRELGFVADTPLEEGLKRTVEWTRKHWDLIEKNILKHQSFLEAC